MMHKVVAIVAQPSQIFNSVVGMVLVNMMDGQNSYVFCFA